MLSASPAKLKSGAWGVRVLGKATVNDVVTVTTRAGKSWESRITRVVYSGDGEDGPFALCESVSTEPPPKRAPTGGGTFTAPVGCNCELCSLDCPRKGRR